MKNILYKHYFCLNFISSFNISAQNTTKLTFTKAANIHTDIHFNNNDQNLHLNYVLCFYGMFISEILLFVVFTVIFQVFRQQHLSEQTVGTLIRTLL